MNIIGLDGGATKIRGTSLEINVEQKLISAHKLPTDIIYNEQWKKQFQIIPLQQQLQEFKENNIKLTDQEKEYGLIFIQSAAKLICQYSAHQPVRVGIGMPGIKTEDKKGIAVMANGPRIPKFLHTLTEILQQQNVYLENPIHCLGSDADYCGLGEEYHVHGQFRNTKNALYLGIGTGIADALKIQNKVLSLDNAPWLPKSWEMVTGSGKTFEQMISMAGIARQYNGKTGKNFNAGQIFERSLEHDSLAEQLVESAALHLAELFYDRMQILIFGTSQCYLLPARQRILPMCPYKEQFWNKIILGQRIAHIWKEDAYKNVFQDKVLQHLEDCMKQLPREYKNQYNIETLIQPSFLQEAPIFGAGISAIL